MSENTRWAGDEATDVETARFVSTLIQAIPVPTIALRPDGGRSVFNDSYRQLFALDAPGAEPAPLHQVVHPEDVQFAFDVIAACQPGETHGPLDIRLRRPDATWRVFSSMLRLDPDTGWIVATAMDVTAQTELQHELLAEARTDPLTGLANRAGLLDALESSLRSNPAQTVVAVDLDRFKAVNDTFGHETGDDVLVATANRLRSLIGESGVVARVGGDEFVILINDAGVTPAQLGPALIRAVTESIELGDRHLGVGCSIGIAEHDGTSDAESLLRNADHASYAAKEEPGSAWKLADPQLVAERKRLTDLEQELRASLGHGHFVPWFQPIVDLQTGGTVAYESRARWVREGHVIQSASSFLDVAADIGLLSSIGHEVAHQTLALVDRLPEGLVAINLSSAELADDEWLNALINQTEAHGIEPERIVFEVTERVLAVDLALGTERLHKLARRGFRIALDEFGCGHPAITSLTALPIHAVKLDGQLLRDRHTSARAQQTFEAIVRFVQDLDHAIIVAGVATPADCDHLLQLGVQFGQGDYCGPSQSPDALNGPVRVPA